MRYSSFTVSCTNASPSQITIFFNCTAILFLKSLFLKHVFFTALQESSFNITYDCDISTTSAQMAFYYIRKLYRHCFVSVSSVLPLPVSIDDTPAFQKYRNFLGTIKVIRDVDAYFSLARNHFSFGCMRIVRSTKGDASCC
jgi:hypothetical protein